MWFRRKNSLNSPESQSAADTRAQDTIDAFASGGLPKHVLDRITSQREGVLPWTSALTVSEFAALMPYGVRALGMVYGSSVYHVGYNAQSYVGSWDSFDVTDVEQALFAGRRQAIQRLREEAKSYGADAVVGLCVEVREPHFSGEHECEFVAYGTAISLPLQVPATELLLCSVDARELVKLLSQGVVPVGVAMGVSVYYQYTNSRDAWRTNSWSNQEVPVFTQAVYHTRNRAVSRLRDDAKTVQGTGVLAERTELRVQPVRVKRNNEEEREDHILEFFAIGTVVSHAGGFQSMRPAGNLDLGK